MVRLILGGMGPEGSRLPERFFDVQLDPETIEDSYPRSSERGPGLMPHPSVASLDLNPAPGDVEANLLLAEAAITDAKRKHPSLRWVVLPEMFTTGYTDLASVHRHAEDAEHGMSAWRLSALAHSLGVYIAYGFPEILPRGGVANSASLVGPDHPGPLLTYRKRNLVRTTEEVRLFVPGDVLPVVEAGGLRVALAICWDLGHPEVVREAAFEGAELILALAAWRDPWSAQFDLSCAARALDSGVYLASANQRGVYPEATFSASGSVYGPDGGRVSENVDHLSVGTLDPEFPGRWRNRYGNTLGGAVAGGIMSTGELEEIC